MLYSLLLMMMMDDGMLDDEEQGLLVITGPFFIVAATQKDHRIVFIGFIIVSGNTMTCQEKITFEPKKWVEFLFQVQDVSPLFLYVRLLCPSHCNYYR
jgi:hypothetical protein